MRNHTLPIGETNQVTVDCLPETIKTNRKQHKIFQMLKENNCQSISLYLVKISLRKEGEIETSSDGRKGRVFVLCEKTQHRRITKRSSLNIKETIKKNWNMRKEKENNKNMGRYVT